jgi:hypothetical protein
MRGGQRTMFAEAKPLAHKVARNQWADSDFAQLRIGTRAPADISKQIPAQVGNQEQFGKESK